MKSAGRFIAPLVLALLFARAGVVAAQQGFFVTAGRVLAGSPEESSFRATLERDVVGPVGIDASFITLPGGRPSPGRLYGMGADITLFSGNRGNPTLFAGGAAGIGTDGQEKLWASASIGARMAVVSVGPFRLMAEGRWRSLTIEGRDGFEVAAAFGWRGTNRSRGPTRPESLGLWLPRATADVLRANGIPEAKARQIDNVITTALESMGSPYVWGGTGDGDGGFDCSGLIYYAYRQHGISVPRTSQGQSKAGTAIRRELELLLPGDLLTFSERGDSVSHVGLYVGEGKFIHSASSGVRLSQLSDDDPDGRTWLKRWTGVRRVIE
jgi:cell wall-associated NlpC family hydrolase